MTQLTVGSGDTSPQPPNRSRTDCSGQLELHKISLVYICPPSKTCTPPEPGNGQRKPPQTPPTLLTTSFSFSRAAFSKTDRHQNCFFPQAITLGNIWPFLFSAVPHYCSMLLWLLLWLLLSFCVLHIYCKSNLRPETNSLSVDYDSDYDSIVNNSTLWKRSPFSDLNMLIIQTIFKQWQKNLTFILFMICNKSGSQC